MLKNVSLLHVFYVGSSNKIAVGRLIYKDRQILFEYNLDFLRSGIELSPFKLPLKPGVVASDDLMFEGLFGVFNDSLPDGWGRLLLDRKLMGLGINPGELSPSGSEVNFIARNSKIYLAVVAEQESKSRFANVRGVASVKRKVTNASKSFSGFKCFIGYL
jgi:hypothetical protein